MNEEAKKLLLDIAMCDELSKARTDKFHPCYKIVHYQDDLSAFQIPEPWNGDIENAEILFISSNPSIDMTEKEDYPQMLWNENKKTYQLKGKWTEKDVECFFANRLKSDEYKKRMKSENKTDGAQYWYRSRMVAAELLDMKLDDDRLEDYYCYTEIVHCKSKNEEGVCEACKKCFSKSTIKIINLAKKVKYIIVVGRKAQKQFDIIKREYDLDKVFEEKKIKVIYSYAPRWWGMAKPKPAGVEKITREVYIEHFIRPHKKINE